MKVGNETVVDEWIAYLEVHPVDAWGDKLIDECDYNDDTYEDMNPVHIAVLRNKVKILEKLAKAGAGKEVLMLMYTDIENNYIYVLSLRIIVRITKL